MRTGLRCDQVGKPTLPKARSDFPSLLRKVRYYDEETNRDFVFLTKNLNVPALTVPKIYRLRWRIEIFFRWIKGNRLSSPRIGYIMPTSLFLVAGEVFEMPELAGGSVRR